MRTTKRFTKAVVERFDREGRGQGVFESYSPYHQVSRGDPASSGRSHLHAWRSRLRSLLSDGELGVEFSCCMLPELDDVTEQYPLDWLSELHPLCRYGYGDPTVYPGTIQIAEELGFKHPRLRDGSGPWCMTTDFVIVLDDPRVGRSMLAVARKPKPLDASDPKDRRPIQLLKIEREFWRRRNVEWLLITPNELDVRVRMELSRSAPWALAADVDANVKEVATRIAKAHRHMSLTVVLEAIAPVVGSQEIAQAALWQSIWRGELPIDLRRSWRPYLPLRHISSEEFWSFNPVRSRRSSWQDVAPLEG